jgi:hypothetical protein
MAFNVPQREKEKEKKRKWCFFSFQDSFFLPYPDVPSVGFFFKASNKSTYMSVYLIKM